jgi:peptide/nickel transport system ATP-binding protein/oligopeptide transport system ATP-binding protein
MSDPLLEVRELATHFFSDEGVVRAVDGVSFAVERGEVLALVGESGSGKSVTALSILRLVPAPGRIVGGAVVLGAKDERPALDLVRASDAELRSVRGRRVAMVFQDPMTALNPYLTVGAQLVEVLDVHQGLRGRDARERAATMLGEVGIPAPEARLDDYPHRLSGGMRQRVMIAMALLGEPELLIADEPTTALDVTVQAQILDLLLERRRATGLAVLLITHDLGVVARAADRVTVMYAGRLVEEAGVEEAFAEPLHPYTRALGRAVPRLGATASGGRLEAIGGAPPSLGALPPGCPYHPRCEHAVAVCRERFPEERSVSSGAAAGEPPVARAHRELLGRRRVWCHVDLAAPTPPAAGEGVP